MTAHFDVEVPVVTTGRLPRSRSLQLIRGQVTHRVCVEEVSGEEAPLAATVGSNAIRVFGGKTYARIGSLPRNSRPWRIDPYEASVYSFKDRLEYRRVDNLLRKQIRNDDIVQTAGDDGIGLGNIETLRIRGMNDDLIGEQVVAFQCAIGFVVMIEGGLYMRIDEPAIVLRESSDVNAMRCDLVPKHDDLFALLRGKLRVHGVFSIGALDDATARCRALSAPGEGGRQAGKVKPDQAIAVHRADLFSEHFLAANAAVMAAMISTDILERRFCTSSILMIDDILGLGMERLQQFRQMTRALQGFLETRQPGSLVDNVADLLDLPDTDPFWHGTRVSAEQMAFTRERLDNDTIYLDIG